MRSPAAAKWGAEDLWRELKTVLPGLAIEVVPLCDSTNTQLVERARRMYTAELRIDQESRTDRRSSSTVLMMRLISL
jgi:hypothetical protein